MKPEILNYLLPIVGISLALGLPLGWPSKRLDTQYDERQLIEKGKAARLAQCVVLVYLFALFIGVGLLEMPQEYTMTMVVAGIFLVAMTEQCYCIFHDAAIPNERSPMVEGGLQLILGMLWFLLAVGPANKEQDILITHILLAVSYTFGGLCMILRALYLRFQAKKEGEE